MRKAMRSDGREEFVTMGGVPVGFRDDWHLTMMVGTRSGKGCSVLVSTLLSCGGLEISIDPKGDHASTTARYRDQVLEQNVAVLPG
ncbi:MAG: type IV secretory system conjugative DNA transfer family protein [Verrucomicrobiota bacterium]